MRLICKWLLGISIGVLITLILFTFVSWAIWGATGMFFYALSSEGGSISPEEISLTGFFSNFVGSPMFYMYLADIFVLVLSIVGFVVTRLQMPK